MAKAAEVEKTRGDPLASAEDKKKALEAARLQIEKQFGAGSIIRLGNTSNVAGIEVVPSGAILLDEALGIGGYPRGRIIEIYGPESSGKTTLALHAIAEAQKLGGIAAFVDAEHALDPVYAKNLGVNIDELWVSQPDSGEQALEITENLVRSGALDVIVVDSVAALTPQAEIDGDMGDAQMGLQARLMSQAMRKLTAIIGKSRTVLIFINQIRMKIGVMFGNPETTTGGNALKFYSSLRLEVRKTETIEGGKDTDAVGNRVRVKVVKNKVAPPFRKAELEVIFGKGVSATASLLDGAVKYALIDKKGAWYSYGEEKVGQGRDSARDYLEQNPAFAKQIEEKLRKIIFPGREFPVAVEKPKASGSAPLAGPAAAPADSSAAAATAGPAAGVVPISGALPISGVGPAPDMVPVSGPVPVAAADRSPDAGLPESPERGTPVSARQDPFQPEPFQPEPTQPEPARPEPSRPEPARPEPVQSAQPVQPVVRLGARPSQPILEAAELPRRGRPPISQQPILEPAEAPRRGPGRPPAAESASAETLRRGPGRPPASQPEPGSAELPRRGPGRPPAPPPEPAEAPHRGPGRPRKAAPGEGGEVLF
jgi:recombination protein RecA